MFHGEYPLLSYSAPHTVDCGHNDAAVSPLANSD